jgi:glycosidase
MVLASCFKPDLTEPKPIDCDIQWSAVLHDTFDPQLRSPVGALPVNQDVTLSIRTQKNDLSAARLRLWNDRTNQETYLALAPKKSEHPTDLWTVTFNTGPEPTIWYYFFELNAAATGCSPDQDFYVDDNTQIYGGGPGVVIDNYDDWRSFQITVYDPTYKAPSWAKGASVYQIFPDRLRDGDASNNTKPKQRFYDDPNGAIFRSNTNDWSAPVCDPRGVLANSCEGVFGQNFYGGDLKGASGLLAEKYLDAFDALYLNPIFRAPSNHRYDPYHWAEIEPELGTKEDFISLVSVAKQHNIKLILDGVFNHVSSDSPWFDRYQSHAEQGACESDASPYTGYFQMEPSSTRPCSDGSYKTFGGYNTLPKLNTDNKSLRKIIFDSVSTWNMLGVAGWRLDAAQDVDSGPTNDPSNTFWEELSKQNKDQWIIGEAWGDAAPGLLGGEWHSATNYRLRGAILSWLFTSCQGLGCAGDSFSDNDSNAKSFSGEIKNISLAQFHLQLLSIWEDYPPEAFATMMNILGSHDTNRALWLLQKISGEDESLARKKLQLAWLFLCTYPGAPTIYYGDESAMNTPGVWDGSTWQDDPYNRATLPLDARVDPFLTRLLLLRRENKLLREGDVKHGVLLDEQKQLYGFTRTLGDETALIVLNRSQSKQETTIALTVKSARELLSGETLSLRDGSLPLTIGPMQGAIVLLTK